MDRIRSQIKEQMTQIAEEGINPDNVEYLGKIVDIEKDLVKKCLMEEEMYMGRYRDSYRDSYGHDEYGNSYGRREVEGRYGRRGYDAKYRAGNQLDEMGDYYKDYRDSSSYGAGQDTKKALKYMLEAGEDFIMHLKEEANSQEEIEMIRDTLRRMAENV